MTTGESTRRSLQPRQRRQAVHARQPDIEHDDVVRRTHHAVDAGLTAVDGIDDVAFVAQHAAQRAAHAGFVVDDEDSSFHLVVSPSLVMARRPDVTVVASALTSAARS